MFAVQIFNHSKLPQNIYGLVMKSFVGNFSDLSYREFQDDMEALFLDLWRLGEEQLRGA